MPVPGSDPRYRFLARFGATILSGGIAAIPMALYHYQAELSLVPQEVWFVGYILAHRWTADLPYPSLRRMSRRTGVSTQMLHRYKQSLIQKGYLQTIPRHRPSGGRTSNYYDFSTLFHTLESFLARDRRDAQWQPSADEFAEESLDDREDGFDPEDGVPPSVPPSQQMRVVPLSPAVEQGRQPTLTGGLSPRGVGAALAEASPPAPLGQSGLARHNTSHEKTPPVQTFHRESRAQAPDPDVRPSHEEPAETRGTPKRPLRGVPPEEPNGSDARTARDAEAAGAAGNPLAEWRRILDHLSGEVSEASLAAWLLPVTPSWAPDGRLRLVCQSTFHLQQVERRFRAAIERAVGAPVEIALG